MRRIVCNILYLVIVAFDLAIFFEPDYASSYSNLAVALDRVRDSLRSSKLHRAARVLQPLSPEIMLNQATGMVARSEFETAEYLMLSALSLRHPS